MTFENFFNELFFKKYFLAQCLVTFQKIILVCLVQFLKNEQKTKGSNTQNFIRSILSILKTKLTIREGRTIVIAFYQRWNATVWLPSIREGELFTFSNGRLPISEKATTCCLLRRKATNLPILLPKSFFSDWKMTFHSKKKESYFSKNWFCFPLTTNHFSLTLVFSLFLKIENF